MDQVEVKAELGDELPPDPNIQVFDATKEELDEDDSDPMYVPETRGSSQDASLKSSNGNKRYLKSWERRFPWVERAVPGKENAFCKVCSKTINPKLASLQVHARTKGHQLRMRELMPEAFRDEDEETRWGSQNVICNIKTEYGVNDQRLAIDLGKLTLASDIETIMEVVGPKIFDNLSIWEVLLYKASQAKGEAAAMDLVVQDTENILTQLKLLISNCYEYMRGDSTVPKIESEANTQEAIDQVVDQRKSDKCGVGISRFLANALEIQDGYWQNRDDSDAIYRNAMDVGILGPLAKVKVEHADPSPAYVDDVQHDLDFRAPTKKRGRPRGRPSGSKNKKKKPQAKKDDFIDDEDYDEEEETMGGDDDNDDVDEDGDDEDEDEDDDEARKRSPGKTRTNKACPKCGKPYKFEESLKKHNEHCRAILRYAKEAKGFLCLYQNCPTPNKAFSAKDELLTHFDEHHFTDEDRTIDCTYDECKTKFATVVLRNMHIRKNHEKRFVCDNCPKKFWNQKNLDDHIERVHNRPEGEGARDMNPCRKCGKMIAMTYITIHESKCNGLSVRNPQFKKVGDEYYCTARDCTIKHGFSCEYGVRTHFFNTHLNDEEKIYTCDFCERKFGCKIARNKHVKATHLKPYVCDQCGGRFGTKSKLDSHRLTHTGEKPFACDQCDYRAAKKFNLDEHKQKRHNDMGGRNFYCGLCGKMFLTSGRLTSHFRIIHHDGKVEEPPNRKKQKKKFVQIQQIQAQAQPNVQGGVHAVQPQDLHQAQLQQQQHQQQQHQQHQQHSEQVGHQVHVQQSQLVPKIIFKEGMSEAHLAHHSDIGPELFAIKQHQSPDGVEYM